MPIQKSVFENNLRPFLLHHMDKEAIDFLLAADFLRIYNAVARDINDQAQLRLERFHKHCNSTNAEDSNLTNYLLAGKVRKIFKFIFKDSEAYNQYYSYIDDRVILKVPPTEDTLMDIYYLRDTEDIVNDSDEIDLPDECLFEYMDLVKEKILTDYPSKTYQGNYNALLRSKIVDIKMKIDRPIKNDVVKRWFGQYGDEDIYLITDHYIGIENFVEGVDNNYTYIDA